MNRRRDRTGPDGRANGGADVHFVGTPESRAGYAHGMDPAWGLVGHRGGCLNRNDVARHEPHGRAYVPSTDDSGRVHPGSVYFDWFSGL